MGREKIRKKKVTQAQRDYRGDSNNALKVDVWPPCDTTHTA